MTTSLLTTYSGFKPIRKVKVELAEGVVFHKEPYKIKNRFVNLYWVEFKRKNSLFCLKNILGREPLVKIFREAKRGHNLNSLAGINTCNFFLSDYGREPPIPAYNFFVSKGRVWQFPTNERVALIEKGSSLKLRRFKAMGKMRIGKKLFNWIGRRVFKQAHFVHKEICPLAVVSGVFEISFKYLDNDKLRRAKKPIPSTLTVKCGKGKALLGIDFDNEFCPKVLAINSKQLSLLDYLYIIEIDQVLGKEIHVGDEISDVVIDGYRVEREDNIVSLGFSLPKQREKLGKILIRELISKDGGPIKVLDEDFRKPWSAIVFTKKKIIFFLVDAYPYRKEQEGLNIYELQELLSKKFDFIKCGVCDGGQTSKLCINNRDGLKIFGNLHYVNYSLEAPKRDGRNGRPIPSALIGFSTS